MHWSVITHFLLLTALNAPLPSVMSVQQWICADIVRLLTTILWYSLIDKSMYESVFSFLLTKIILAWKYILIVLNLNNKYLANRFLFLENKSWLSYLIYTFLKANLTKPLNRKKYAAYHISLDFHARTNNANGWTPTDYL